MLRLISAVVTNEITLTARFQVRITRVLLGFRTMVGLQEEMAWWWQPSRHPAKEADAIGGYGREVARNKSRRAQATNEDIKEHQLSHSTNEGELVE